MMIYMYSDVCQMYSNLQYKLIQSYILIHFHMPDVDTNDPTSSHFSNNVMGLCQATGVWTAGVKGGVTGVLRELNLPSTVSLPKAIRNGK